MENISVEKRKRVILTEDESRILKWLYLKTLIPMLLAIVVSSTVLYFGFEFLMKKTSFANYGLAPASSMDTVAKFISTYAVIALSNIVLIIALSAVVMYLVLHDIVMPVMRVTRELRYCLETKEKKIITIRTTDKLLRPLVELINKLIA